MFLLIRTVLGSLPLVALPAMAATGEVETGITSVGPSVFIFVIALALFLTLVFRASAAHVARRVGSRSGRRKVRRQLHGRCQELLEDVILPGAYGGLARIDFSAFVGNGILCLRVVHMNGSVSGGPDEAQWTCVDGPARRRFLNPLIQNEGRARAIRNAAPGIPVANLVVFTGSVTFEERPADNVLTASELGAWVDRLTFEHDPSVAADTAWQQLVASVLGDEQSRRDFAAQISFG